MKIFRYLLRSLRNAVARQTEQPDAQTRHDIDLEPMAAEHLNDQRLWRELAA